MAADLTGIDNVGEFFSQHYFTELLEKDLADQTANLALAVEKVQKALTALGRDLLRLLGEARLHPSPVAADAQTARIRDQRARALYELGTGDGRRFQVQVAEALGFSYQSGAFFPLDDGRAAPALHVVERHGEPYLVVLEGRFRAEDEALLDVPWIAPLPASAYSEGLKAPAREDTLGDVMAAAFARERPPRWIVLVAGAELLLAERPRWGRGQYLRFDLSELLGRRDAGALRLTAALLCRESLVPDGGALLHDSLDEKSHRHAQGVSADLKYAAREAVELIANEWVYYQRTVAKKAIHGERVARELTEECLVYLYRLLVLFYVEARAGELGVLPMNSPEYALGYSLEALRDLEQVNLGPETRYGFFFDESLRTLFRLVNDGYAGSGQLPLASAGAREGIDERGFLIDGLKSPLFDERSTPRLSKVRFRNEVLQKVVRLLSLTPEARRARGGRSWGRGRISYAQLGINQLGAVYEGLLSYTGFFARETLYEVHRAGEKAQDATQQAWFVPERDIVRYREEELLFEEGGQKRHRKYEPGTFIYRLAGRDRESSASYYTPEVLTRCLVKYALRELLEGKSASDILELNICEPAMGSGAFLVEAIDQLADAYLERRQQELGRRVPPAEYALEKQRVKTYLAEARCYGVDLNPMAAKLAGVSLWLATLHKGQRTPWFGARLAVGNSLVGARLEVWAADDFDTDEALAKAVSTVLKKTGDKGDLEGELERVLAAHEPRYAEAVAEVRARVERARRLAGVPAEGEDEGSEGDSAEENEAQQAEAQRKEVGKALKKLAAELKLPRHHRRPPRKVEAKAVVAGERPVGSVWHFLVPDAGMSPFEGDKVVAELAPEAVRRLKEWRKSVEEPWNARDIGRLQELSNRVDKLYREYVEARMQALADVTPTPSVWGQDVAPRGLPSIEDRERRLKAIRVPGSAYAWLKQVMDLWAALWAFPIEHADLLPTREGWLRALEELLAVETRAPEGKKQISIWPKTDDDDEVEEKPKDAANLWTAAEEACARLRPLHWDLAFPEVFVECCGFDLLVGNPPWMQLSFDETGVLSELDARLVLDNCSAIEVEQRRSALLTSSVRLWLYLGDVGHVRGYKSFIGSPIYNPLLIGCSLNLYKCFLAAAWRIGSPKSVVALVHQDGLFDDPLSQGLRWAIYRRLSIVLRFKNQFQLFPDVDNQVTFALTVSRAQVKGGIRFDYACNLFHPSTFDRSLVHDGCGAVPSIKSDDNQFEVRGHRNRIAVVTSAEMDLFATVFSMSSRAFDAPILPLLHSQDVLEVLRPFASLRRLQSLRPHAMGTRMWHERDDQSRGTIRRQETSLQRTEDWIVGGSHFHIGTPFQKSPRENCRSNRDYDVIDLTKIHDEYLPRTLFVPACHPQEYERRAPKFRGKPVTAYYRHVNRSMLAISGERTLIPAIVPPGAGHVDAVHSVCFASNRTLVECSAFWSSIVADFFLRCTGKSHLSGRTIYSLPIPTKGSAMIESLVARALRLNCLTSHYSAMWNDVWPQIRGSVWSIRDRRLASWPQPGDHWHRACALRNHFERRWALVEIDALAALEMGISIGQLCTIYQTQFGVLREYERTTLYDQRGRIAFTRNQGLNVGLDREAMLLWQHCLKEGKPLPKGFDTQGLEPPFEIRDREADMRTAYAFFADKLGKRSAS
ncbi:N-6 DNA methylase [Sorangium sp. So ce1335]|uniref:N-6 DNA methylase n=1 Tax=Sorangium sp. So ce1335 TaxID=3133335 RepID=UPI003F5F7323